VTTGKVVSFLNLYLNSTVPAQVAVRLHILSWLLNYTATAWWLPTLRAVAQSGEGYVYVYVAQIALGANMAQTIKVLKEAEAYKGPSLIIAYAPCINHGLKAGMAQSVQEQKKAVDAGYWHLYHFNPDLIEEGKNPFSLDSKEPTTSFRDFIMGEVRYASLVTTFPESAEELFVGAEKYAKVRYESYKRLADQKWD